MAHSLTPSPPTPTPFSTRAKKITPLPFLGFQKPWSGHQVPVQALDDQSHTQSIDRRAFIWGLTGATLGSNVGNQSASAAKRRPPPPPPVERKDPNVSGVQAKVLASMKRKEAMKEAMAKLKEEGKPISEPSK